MMCDAAALIGACMAARLVLDRTNVCTDLAHAQLAHVLVRKCVCCCID